MIMHSLRELGSTSFKSYKSRIKYCITNVSEIFFVRSNIVKTKCERRFQIQLGVTDNFYPEWGKGLR
jgi:hypothetical protein